jgi:hypothetical protein
MRSRPRRHDKSASDTKTSTNEVLSMMFKQAKAQFGDAVKSFWFYDGDLCPRCMARPIDAMKIRGKDALSINAFIYRPRGVLIGYFLCQTCATYIFDEAQKHPYKQTPLHANIEQNLSAAYHNHLASLDA